MTTVVPVYTVLCQAGHVYARTGGDTPVCCGVCGRRDALVHRFLEGR